MKKIVSVLAVVLTAALSGCATSPQGANTTIGAATSIGGSIFKAAIDNQCRVTLNNNTAFRAVALTMTPQQQNDLETSICSCVSDQAMQNVTVVDLAQAATDPAFRNQMVVTVVGRSLNACYNQFIRR